MTVESDRQNEREASNKRVQARDWFSPLLSFALRPAASLPRALV